MPAYAQPLDPTFTFIDKTIIKGCCCNDIYGEKATPGYYHPISCHLPENSIFSQFWPFFTICAYACKTPWPNLHFYWPKCYYWVLLQWYLWRESYSRLLPPHFPAICLKIEFLDIFSHFLPFVPSFGQPHDLISTLIDKNVITGYCCNDI